MRFTIATLLLLSTAFAAPIQVQDDTGIAPATLDQRSFVPNPRKGMFPSGSQAASSDTAARLIYGSRIPPVHESGFVQHSTGSSGHDSGSTPRAGTGDRTPRQSDYSGSKDTTMGGT